MTSPQTGSPSSFDPNDKKFLSMLPVDQNFVDMYNEATPETKAVIRKVLEDHMRGLMADLRPMIESLKSLIQVFVQVFKEVWPNMQAIHSYIIEILRELDDLTVSEDGTDIQFTPRMLNNCPCCGEPYDPAAQGNVKGDKCYQPDATMTRLGWGDRYCGKAEMNIYLNGEIEDK